MPSKYKFKNYEEKPLPIKQHSNTQLVAQCAFIFRHFRAFVERNHGIETPDDVTTHGEAILDEILFRLEEGSK